MNQEKEYFAFISYQRKDEEWADRLRNKLEHYRLPSSVRKQNASLPKEIRPIFRDALELAGGVLAKEIETALQQSKYLIVICSPNSARSPWGNKEIQTFIDLGREDRIIPFIIDGTPFSDDEETECFPPALHSLKGEKELLGININELSRDAASVKVVARMFGLKFDTLWQRYEREKKRKRWMMLGGSLLFAIAAMVIASIFFNLNNELKNTINDRDNALYVADSALTQVRKDSVVLAEHLERIMRDSLTLAKQKDSIKHKKNEIATERDNVKSANSRMKINLSRFLVNEAFALLEAEDYYLGRLLALYALPPYCPYTIGAEKALREADCSDNSIFKGHAQEVMSVTFSKDGQLIASAAQDETIRIWDKKTGRCLKVLSGHHGGVLSVAYSTNSKLLASTSRDSTIRIWDASSGRCLKVLKGHRGIIESASFSNDSHYLLSSSNDKTVRVWDVATGICCKILEMNHVPLGDVSFSPNGRYITITSPFENRIYIWDCDNNYSSKDINGLKFYNASWSPDSRQMVSIASDRSVIIWDVETSTPIRFLVNQHDDSNSQAVVANYSDSGKSIIAIFENNTIKKWDVKTGELLSFYEGPKVKDVYNASVNPNENEICSCVGNLIYYWKIHNTQYKKSIDIDARFVKCFPNSSLFVSTSEDKTIRIWDESTYNCKMTLKGHTSGVLSADFDHHENRLISSSWDKTIRLWNTSNGECINILKGHGNFVHSVVFSSDKKNIISTSGDKTVRLWDAKTGECIKVLNGHKGWVNYARTSPDGQLIVSASNDNTIRIWKTSNGECLAILEGHNDNVNYVEFSPSGKLIISASDDKTLRLWDVKTCKCLQIYKGHTGIVWSGSFSPNGHYVVSSSSDSTVRVWDVDSGLSLVVLKGHEGVVRSASFNSDGIRIMSASDDKTIKVWDFPPIPKLINATRERFKNRQLTKEERRKYYLE